MKEKRKGKSQYLSSDLTCEWVSTSRLSRSHHMAFGVFDYKIGNLVEEHRAEVILLQKVVRCQPGVLGHVVRQLHGWPALIHIDGEDVVIFLRGDQESFGVGPNYFNQCAHEPSSPTFPS